MRRASAVVGPAVLSLLHGAVQQCGAATAHSLGQHSTVAAAAFLTHPCSTTVAQPVAQLLHLGHVCSSFHSSSSFSSSSSSSSKKGHGQHTKHGRSQQQQQQQQPAAAPWPHPSRLVVPDRKAVAPPVGRVPPSSRAAAAATASIIKGAAASAAAAAAARNAKAKDQKPVIHIAGRFATADSTATAADLRPRSSSSSSTTTSSSSSSSTTQDRPSIDRPAAHPWEVIAALPRSQQPCYTLENMVNMDIHLYLNYLRDARLGMPSVFDLGVARSQGTKGREHLLRRELLLRHFLQQQQQQTSDTAAAVAEAVTDEQLLEASNDDLAAAAAAAAAATAKCAGADRNELMECLMDYFVMKQCLQLMLYQRQHRQSMQDQYTHWQQQQQRSGSSSNSKPPLSNSELQAVDIFDAFFDITLADYEQYLAAAAAGEPSIYTSMNPFMNANPQRQQQQQQDLDQARSELAAAAAVLAQLPDGIKARPLMLITGHTIMQLSMNTGLAPDVVIQVFDGFYSLKRLGFRAALEVLMQQADERSGSLQGSRF